jgi:hypothetical protein
MLLAKKYIYFSLIGLFSVSAMQAQMGSTSGSKKTGMLKGGFSSNKGMGGGIQSSFSKKGTSIMGGGMGSHSSGSSGSSSQNGSNSTYKSSYSSSTSKTSTTSHYSGISGGSGSSSSSGHGSGSSSSGSSGSSSKVTSATLKGISSSRSFPGIGKSKTINSLKGGTRYSYPGIHNVKNDIAKFKKKTQGGGNGGGSNSSSSKH